MSQGLPSRYRRSSWAIGLAVLLALGFALQAMLRSKVGSRLPAASAAPEGSAAQAARPLPLLAPAAAAAAIAPAIRGVVLRPDGRPAAGAAVTLERALTAWPEWRTERIDQAITRDDGAFQFFSAEPFRCVVGFEHPQFAGGLAEVPVAGGEMTLRLAPGFDLFGLVLTEDGAPIANARVALEAVPGDARRVAFATTGRNGRFQFDNLEAGPARLVARHDSWQPLAVTVVVGDQRRIDLRFERRTMTPLRGRVVSANGQEPIASAELELVPLNQKLGLVDPIRATSAADGSFLLSGVPRGSMRLIVRHPGYGAVVRTQSIGALAAEVVLEMPMRSRVEGQLYAEAEAQVHRGGELLQIQDISGQIDFAVVAPDGRFRFGQPLSPGWAELRVLDSSFAFHRSQAASATLRIEETSTTVLEVAVVPAGAVRGRFVDGAGRPLGGVAVRPAKILIESARNIGDAAVQLDLTSVGSQVAQLFGVQRNQPLCVSAPDGTFVVRGIRPGVAFLRADLRGHGTVSPRVMMPSLGNTTELGDVMLPVGCRVDGRVLRGNRPLAGATVTLAGLDVIAQGAGVTDGSGSFTIEDLPPGNYRARARLAAQATGVREQVIQLVPGRQHRPLLLVLPAGRTVSGLVTSRDGQPIGGALVSVRGSAGRTVATDDSGEFLLELPERVVELQVSLGDRGRQHVVAVPADCQRLTVPIDTPPNCTLVGQVIGLPGKRRVGGVLVRATPLDGGDGAAVRTRWLETVDGELRWPQCPSGRVRIEISSDGYAPYAGERVLPANEEHNLGEIVLETGSRVRGVVRDEDGVPVAGAYVLLGEETDFDLFEPRVRTGADGRFEIHGVTSRSSRLVVRAAGYAPRLVDLELPRDALSAAPLPIALERGATVEVSVNRALAPDGGIVQLRQAGRILASAELDDQGRAWFANRSAGRYAIRLLGHPEVGAEIDVPPDEPLVRVALR